MQNKFFRQSQSAAPQKLIKIWPSKPLPFDRNQEEPFVYKVLLLWERTADKVETLRLATAIEQGTLAMYFIGHRSQEPHR